MGAAATALPRTRTRRRSRPQLRLVSADPVEARVRHAAKTSYKTRVRKHRGRKSEDFSAYYDDPVGFAIEVLGIKPWSRQIEILRACATTLWVAVRSGQKTGKSMTAVIVAIWFAATRPNARVILSAPTYRQVKRILWKELRNVYPRVRRRLGGNILPKLPETAIELANGSEIWGLSADSPEGVQGISGADVLYIIDESSGYPDSLFEAIIGNTAGRAHIFAITNPTQTSGWFFRIFRTRSADWARIHISSLESPNFAAGKIVMKGMAEPDWLGRLQRMCGQDFESHPMYQVRALGQFPDQSTKSIVAFSALDRARARYDSDLNSLEDHHPGLDARRRPRLIVGVDPARYGDDKFTIIARRGSKHYPPAAHKFLNGSDGAAAVRDYIRPLLEHGEGITPGSPKPRVNVDVIGIGSSVVDFLKLRGDVEVCGINVSMDSDDKEEFPNLRSQLWFAARDHMNTSDAMLPEHDELEADLLAPEYKIDTKGRRRAEPKDDTKKRLGRSPDYGDAFCLSLYEGQSQEGKGGAHGRVHLAGF